MVKKGQKPWNRLKGSDGESPIITLRLAPATIRALAARARREKCTPSAIVRGLIEKYIKR